MSAPLSPRTLPRRRTEDKLFEIGLGTCIEGLRSFSITKTRGEDPDDHDPNNNNATRATIPSPAPSIDNALPPPSICPQARPFNMNRAALHGAPRGGVPVYGNQDARSSLPADSGDAAPVKLKKAAVKIVGRPGIVARPPAPAPSTPAVVPKAPVAHVAPITQQRPVQQQANIVETPVKTPSAAPGTTASRLDELFARLTAASPSPYPTPSSMVKDPVAVTATPAADTPSRAPKITVLEDSEKDMSHAKDSPAKADPSSDDMQSQYLQKALEYLQKLPGHQDTPAALAKSAAEKLQGLNKSTSISAPPMDVEALKQKYAEAVIGYLSGLGTHDKEIPDTQAVLNILEEHNANFFYLCSRLVDAGVLSIKDNLSEVNGLCQSLLEACRSEDTRQEASTDASKKPVSYDPMDKVNAWPSQEKRENAVGCRTVLLKNVGHIKTVNQLQSLVWGGRLESLSLTEAGKDYGLIKFLTAEGCDKYFSDTENGIIVPGDQTKTVIFVERQPGPNSINDLLRNCIEGDATRCVRALDADSDWSDHVLLTFARGKNKLKREVDRIKRGKTARGRYYIEFRFANIYHALNFKRELMEEEDWEHCTIGYGPDPCELAKGVHIKDEDE